MAEFLLNVTANGTNDDGDILCAFNERAIGLNHAHQICHFKNAPYNSDGLKLSGCLTDIFNKSIYQYTFQRLNKSHVVRIDNRTGTEEIFGPESITVEDYVRANKYFMFGKTGKEYWYGGSIRAPETTVDEIWTKIEEKSEYRRVNHRRWNLGRQEYKSFLALSTYNFDDAFANLAVSPLDSEGENQRLYKRMCFVPWRDIRDITRYAESRIIDKTDSIDMREDAIFIPQDLIQIKGLREVRRGRHFKTKK